MKVWLWRGEDYPVYGVETEPPPELIRKFRIELDVPQGTLERWEKAAESYNQLQAELHKLWESGS